MMPRYTLPALLLLLQMRQLLPERTPCLLVLQNGRLRTPGCLPRLLLPLSHS